jgi:hypothetical protein
VRFFVLRLKLVGMQYANTLCIAHPAPEIVPLISRQQQSAFDLVEPQQASSGSHASAGRQVDNPRPGSGEVTGAVSIWHSHPHRPAPNLAAGKASI